MKWKTDRLLWLCEQVCDTDMASDLRQLIQYPGTSEYSPIVSNKTDTELAGSWLSTKNIAGIKKFFLLPATSNDTLDSLLCSHQRGQASWTGYTKKGEIFPLVKTAVLALEYNTLIHL